MTERVDYVEQVKEKTFREVLAFRWNDEYDPDDAEAQDRAYEVVDSPWLERHVSLQRRQYWLLCHLALRARYSPAGRELPARTGYTDTTIDAILDKLCTGNDP